MRLFCIALTLMSTLAHGAEYRTLQTEASRLSFAYTQMGVPMDGRFRKFTANLVFDPARPTAAQTQFEVELASIDTGLAEANDEVLGKAWFNAKAHPTARFVSSAVKVLGPNRYEVTGQLTIKGRTQEVSAPFTFTPSGNQGTFEGAFTLKRLDFAIGEGAWADVSAVANEVRIKFQLVAVSAPARKK